MNTFQHLLAYLQQSNPAVAGGPSVDSFARALYRDLARESATFGDNVTPFSPPSWRPHSGKYLDVVWLKDVLERFSWFDPETVDLRVGQLARIDGGPNRLGVYYDLGLVTIRVQRPRTTRSDVDVPHPQLSEAAVRELFSGWIRATAGGDLELLRDLRRNFTLYVVVDDDAFNAPQVRTAGAAQVDQADGPTIGVITVNLRDLHSGFANVAAIRSQLDQALEPLSGRGAAGRPGGDWHAAFGISGLSVRDRFRERVKQVIQDLMGLLEETAGSKGHASDDAALGHLREAASLVFFRLIFLVTLENRNLLWNTSAAKLRTTWPSFEELVVRRRSAIRGETGLLQGLLYRSREVRSTAKKSQLAIHGASIFRSRPSDDFHEEIERWLSPLDGLDVSAPKLSGKLLAAWEAALAEAIAVAQGQIGEVSEGAHAVVGLGASAHAQRVLGDVYEQILAMQPVRETGKKSRIILRVAGGKAAKLDAETGGKTDPTKNERHALGAHYTPELLVNEVVRAGLEPLLKDAWRRAGGSPAVDPSQRPPRADAAVLDAYERGILDLRIVDPAMGSGHFLTVTVLELAREIVYMQHFGAPQPAVHFEVAEVPEPWTRLEDPSYGGEPGLMDRLDDAATARLQDLAQRCCYGVDRKPLAVELGKLALWLMTMVARRRLGTTAQAELPEAPPLTFLDKNLRSGDSLIGLTWPEARATLQAMGIDLGGRGQISLSFDSGGFMQPDQARAYEHISDALGLPDAELRARMPSLMRETDAVVDAATKRRLHAAAEVDSQDLSALRGEWFAVMRELADTVAWKWDLALLYRFYPRKGQLEKTLGVASSIKPDEATIAKIKRHARDLGVFHWPLVFSEVFNRENKGFDGIVANPPFKGDRDLRAAIGEAAVTYLRNRYVDGVATLDLCGFFIRQFDRLLGNRASFSTVAPNSIGQGRNRTAGLRPLITGDKPQFVLYRAVQTMPWPGDAAVHIALLAGRRPASATVSVREVGSTLPARSTERRTLRPVATLSSFLDGGVELSLRVLPSGSNPLAFTGMFMRGPFDFESNDAQIVALPSKEKRILFAYLNNKDVQSQPRPQARRVVVDFWDALVERGIEDKVGAQEKWLRQTFPNAMELLSGVCAARSKLARSRDNTDHVDQWWLFGRPRTELRAAWAGLENVISIGAVGKILVPVRLARRDAVSGLEIRPTHKLFILPSESFALWAALSSAVFECFVRRVCSTMKSDLNFSSSHVFPFFPLPWGPSVDKARQRLDPLLPPKHIEKSVGEAIRVLQSHRQAVLDQPTKNGLGQVGKADSFGPTKLYNLFDDPGCTVPAIQRLRELHVALTRAVLDAYGWTDFQPAWEFGAPWIDGTTRYFPNAEARAQILARLQTLNHERHALEVELCNKHNIPVPAATVDDEDDPESE
jgi:hypothetical protein